MINTLKHVIDVLFYINKDFYLKPMLLDILRIMKICKICIYFEKYSQNVIRRLEPILSITIYGIVKISSTRILKHSYSCFEYEKVERKMTPYMY
jgi:hypothetical protein